jgi:hypothetical protein
MASERFELRLDPEILDKVDLWRKDQPGLPSRSEAMRKLLERGLGRQEDEQLFQLTRFNVLTAARTASSAQAISDAYLFAWDNGVFPLFDRTPLHEPFASHFAISRDMVEELSKDLEDHWDAKTVPSFYKMESLYGVRSGRTKWDRMRLILVCRYMFLHGIFDQGVWDAILVGSDHPSEAKSITRKFNRKESEL